MLTEPIENLANSTDYSTISAAYVLKRISFKVALKGCFLNRTVFALLTSAQTIQT
jgi:hypothetical protein